MNNWRHDALAADLAQFLRRTQDRVIWEDMQLGPVGSPRPDVYALPKTFTRFAPLSYEVKISVSDFRSDVCSGKWQSYLKFSSGVIFAVPAGLITKTDVPAGCGLIVRGEESWRMLKGPTLQRIETLPVSAWIKLIIDGIGRQAEMHQCDTRNFSQWKAQEKIRKRYGDRLASALADRDNAEARFKDESGYYKKIAENQIKSEQQAIERIKADVSRSLSELALAVGLNADADHWSVCTRARELKDQVSRDAQIRKMREQIAKAHTALAFLMRDCESAGGNFSKGISS